MAPTLLVSPDRSITDTGMLELIEVQRATLRAAERTIALLNEQIRLLETRRLVLSPTNPSLSPARSTNSPPAFTSSTASSRLQDLANSLQRASERKQEEGAIKEVKKVALNQMQQWQLELTEGKVDKNYNIVVSPSLEQSRIGR